MFNLLNSIFAGKSRLWVTGFCAIVIILLAAIDLWTGYEIGFSIFYGIPIAISAWYINKHTAILFSLISAIIWASIDQLSGHEFSAAWIVYWNGFTRLGYFLVISLLLAELKLHLDYESKLARTDSLTGIMNAQAFKEAVKSILEIASRHKQSYALGYVDLDNFKYVNDKWGHGEGDRVLQIIGSVLSKSIRTSDITGRMGGDEFSVLLPLTDIAGAREVFKKIQENLQEAVREHGWPVGFSIGVAVFNNNQLNLNESLKHADELMYQVKKSGKNSVIFREF